MLSRTLAVVPVLYLIIPLVLVSAQGGAGQFNGESYSNYDLAFHYTPLPGMRDETESGKAQIRADAAEHRTGKSLNLLLALTKGENNAAASWQSLTIQTYPRDAVPDSDDLVAEAKMSAWVVGLTEAAPSPKRIVLSGQNFAVSVFGMQEGRTKKGAVVWTTVRKGKLLSFAFVADSPEQLKALAETMKTVQFF